MVKAFSGVVAPIPYAVFAELAARTKHRSAVAGTGVYNAIVDPDPSAGITWAEELAAELTQRYPGKIHAFDYDRWETSLLITFESGQRTFDGDGMVDFDDVGVPIELPSGWSDP